MLQLNYKFYLFFSTHPSFLFKSFKNLNYNGHTILHYSGQAFKKISLVNLTKRKKKSSIMWLISNYYLICLIFVIIGSVFFLFFVNKSEGFLYKLLVKLHLRSITILEITNFQECKDACLKIKSHCQDLSALGFDCEWVSVNGKQRPVALLQLATAQGLCCLFRLNILKCIPQELKEILYDYKIIKLGITPMHDSNLLMRDYNAQVRCTLDLRFLYPTSTGLAAMAAKEIGVVLNKHWMLRCSNWESLILTESQKDYAAKDAFVAIEIFKKWLSYQRSDELIQGPTFPLYFTARYIDVNFSTKYFSIPTIKTDKRIIPEGISNLNQNKRKISYVTRKSPLYHNCFMHAPDGELLCSCDRRKAQWYVDRGLAEVLPGEPFSIRLLFEPEGRPGDTSGGRFYQHLKQNRCVVCGDLDSYLKHNVVPKEYRKHFPNVMKDHQSHDIVLMCINCHHLASQKNEILRNTLADFCKAPISNSKVTNVRALQKVKNSARALLNSGDVIPEGRRTYLENEIKKHYGVDILSPKILEMAANLKSNIINDQYESHGLKVVNYFTEHGGGLTELEILWRMHFLETMKPQYLPTLWSVTHNHSRVTALITEDNK